MAGLELAPNGLAVVDLDAAGAAGNEFEVVAIGATSVESEGAGRGFARGGGNYALEGHAAKLGESFGAA